MTAIGIVLMTALAPVAQTATLKGAIEAIARGEDAEAAAARVRNAGRPGLWALCDAAKKASGAERGRLFEAVGRFATSEAEWALVVELKGTDAEGKAGAIAGLVHAGGAKLMGTFLRQAASADAPVRAAVVDALIAVKGPSAAQLSALLAHESEHAREVGVAYLVRAESAPEGVRASEVAGPALRDPSALVRTQAVALVRRLKDTSFVFGLSELARGDDDALATAAVEALGELGGWNAASELGAIVVDPATPEGAWRRASAALRVMPGEGFGELLGAVARTKDDRRLGALVALVAGNASEAELDRVVDLLDEPSPARVAAGRMILGRAGEPGKAAAERRLASALPELEKAIRSFLDDSAKGRIPELSASLK